MILRLPYVKCSGAGNDFVLIDNMRGEYSLSFPALARTLCSRPFGIGADGLLIIEPSKRSEFLMRYYNADGSFGGMCGNGGRCIARYAFKAGYVKARMKFEALDFEYGADVVGDEIRLSMKNPSDPTEESAIRELVPGSVATPIFLNTGSPHLVIRVEDVESLEVERLGRMLRQHPRFAPDGMNVNFVKVSPPGSIVLRTYERGVEAETLACGTGSVAAAIASALRWGCTPPVSVHVRSGEVVLVDFRLRDGVCTDVSLQGSAHMLFSGNVFYDDASNRIQGEIPR